MKERKEELIDELTTMFRERLTMQMEKLELNLLEGITNEERFYTYAEVIANYYCLQYERMMSKTTREQAYRNARQVLWWFCRTGDTYLPFSLSKIGQLTSMDEDETQFDHATVLHGARKIKDELPTVWDLRQDIKNISKTLGFNFGKHGRRYITTVDAQGRKASNKKFAEA